MATTLSPAAPSTRAWPRPVADDLAYLRTAIVNVFFLGPPGAGDRGWVLVDAGIFGFTEQIVRAAADRFGEGARPSAIVLTHGHFDHVGALPELAERWDVPVYAHPMELPYLIGRSPYPPPDPTVGGGAMAAMAWMYPRGPIDLGDRVRRLPEDSSVPGMPEWRWIHTPGHSAGHVSLFRDTDRALIAGDAFVTTKQESLIAVLEQRPEIHGPPAYYTPDWRAAGHSVAVLAALEPSVAATGHGRPLRGDGMLRDLHHLAGNFATQAVPEHGRYVGRPAVTNAAGVVSLPPAQPDPVRAAILVLGTVAVAGVVLKAFRRPRRQRRV